MNVCDEYTTDDGYHAAIVIDEYPENPREWDDHVCVLTQLSGRYEQPDKEWSPDVLTAWHGITRYHDTELVERYARAYLGAVAVQWWDDPRSESRVFGYITRAGSNISDPGVARATLASEMAEYAAWCEGEVFGYVVTDRDGQEVQSCFGYYGDDQLPYIRDEMSAAIDAHRAERHAEAQERFRRMVGAYRAAG